MNTGRGRQRKLALCAQAAYAWILPGSTWLDWRQTGRCGTGSRRSRSTSVQAGPGHQQKQNTDWQHALTIPTAVPAVAFAPDELDAHHLPCRHHGIKHSHLICVRREAACRGIQNGLLKGRPPHA